MLSRILNLMKSGTSYSVQQLAEHLHTTPEIIQSSIEYLERLGYIKKIKVLPTCSQSCKNCHGCAQTLSKMPGMWECIQ